MDEEEVSDDERERFASAVSTELKGVNESLHRAVENLNSQGIEAKVYFNAEDGVLFALFHYKNWEWAEHYLYAG